ncbi:MAG: hypothetical protein JRI23_05955 [Deltaproteobacteria bacterium]|jgi:hypothetical protein|nr:hypothetical protein [Deltaproteobacteria bacterium]MBW2531107.1 hypothetical protein [Deltaproteobacteria bacterium]
MARKPSDNRGDEAAARPTNSKTAPSPGDPDEPVSQRRDDGEGPGGLDDVPMLGFDGSLLESETTAPATPVAKREAAGAGSTGQLDDLPALDADGTRLEPSREGAKDTPTGGATGAAARKARQRAARQAALRWWLLAAGVAIIVALLLALLLDR